MRQLPLADPGMPDGRSALRYLGWLIGVVRSTAALAIVMAVLWMLCQAAVPALIGRGIDAATLQQIGGAIDITARGAGSLVAVVAVTVVLLFTSVPLGLVVVLGVPLLMGVVGLLIRPLHRRQQLCREQQGRLTGRAVDL